MRPIAARDGCVSEARAYARSRCRDSRLRDDRCDDVVLVLSELLGNAIRHGRPPLSYDVEVDGEDVVVVVQDAESASPQTAAPAPAAESGRGLVIVEQLARDWGWRACRDGKRVWARL